MDDIPAAILKPEALANSSQIPGLTLEDYLVFLEQLRKFKRHLTAHPTATFKPKSILDQIQFVDTGTNQYVDFYINGHWYSAALTLIV